MPDLRSDPLADGVAYAYLRRALASLDPTDRSLIALRYVSEFSSDEIGRALGLSSSGARGRLSRLLLRLRGELRRWLTSTSSSGNLSAALRSDADSEPRAALSQVPSPVRRWPARSDLPCDSLEGHHRANVHPLARRCGCRRRRDYCRSSPHDLDGTNPLSAIRAPAFPKWPFQSATPPPDGRVSPPAVSQSLELTWTKVALDEPLEGRLGRRSLRAGRRGRRGQHIRRTAQAGGSCNLAIPTRATPNYQADAVNRRAFVSWEDDIVGWWNPEEGPNIGGKAPVTARDILRIVRPPAEPTETTPFKGRIESIAIGPSGSWPRSIPPRLGRLGRLQAGCRLGLHLSRT